jgi:hypothetical protein
MRHQHAVTLLHPSTGVVVVCRRQLVVVDNLSGVQVYSYDGRLVSSPKFPGLRAEVLSSQTVALGPDCVAIVDKTDGKSTRVFPASKLSWHRCGARESVLTFLFCSLAYFSRPVLAAIRVFDVRSAHPVGKPYVHENEIVKISLSQVRPGCCHPTSWFLHPSHQLVVGVNRRRCDG